MERLEKQVKTLTELETRIKKSTLQTRTMRGEAHRILTQEEVSLPIRKAETTSLTSVLRRLKYSITIGKSWVWPHPLEITVVRKPILLVKKKNLKQGVAKTCK